MATYNQPYSEVKNIPFDDCVFFASLKNAEDVYTKDKMNELKNKGRGR
ncbi:MAG: hypothetical protein ACTSSH_01030 [Candidatus Heimdallarchaeota archaeon]